MIYGLRNWPLFLCIAHHRKAGGCKKGLENGGSGLCFIWISSTDGGRLDTWTKRARLLMPEWTVKLIFPDQKKKNKLHLGIYKVTRFASFSFLSSLGSFLLFLFIFHHSLYIQLTLNPLPILLSLCALSFGSNVLIRPIPIPYPAPFHLSYSLQSYFLS